MRRLLLLLSLATIIACEQDVYDKGEGRYSLMRADFAEAHVTGGHAIDYIETDDGDRLQLTTPYTAKWLEKASSPCRILIYYNKVEGQAEALSISQVSAVTPHPSAYFKQGVKTDPVGFESAWLSRNGRYLNFSIVLMVGSTDDQTAIHQLDVVADTTVTHTDGLSTCHLRLYHNQGGVPEYYSQRTAFSIPLEAIKTDSIRMTINTYNGPVVKVFQTRK